MNRTVLLLLTIAFPCLALAEIRPWTNSEGKTIEAALVSLEGENITLKMANGRTYTIELSSLSAADQEFAKSWQAEQQAIADAPKPKTEPIMSLPGKVLYQDSLQMVPEGWRMSHGEWAADENGLTGLELEADDHAAVFKNAMTLKDVIIEFDVMLGETKSAMFGIDDSKDHLCRVTLTNSSFQARKDDNDHEGPDVSKLFNRAEDEFETDEWHTIRIELLGEEMVAQTGDHISLGTDPLLATEKAKWGFVVSGGTVGFRDLTICEALPNEEWEKTGARLKRKFEVE
ncbi:MAG: hypothetical protein AAF491_01160 [Verrucomicrobiota bacterium]